MVECQDGFRLLSNHLIDDTGQLTFPSLMYPFTYGEKLIEPLLQSLSSCLGRWTLKDDSQLEAVHHLYRYSPIDLCYIFLDTNSLDDQLEALSHLSKSLSVVESHIVVVTTGLTILLK